MIPLQTKLQTLSSLVRRELIPQPGVAKISSCRRFTTIFSHQSPADSVFFLEAGLVKICKQGEDGREIVVSIVAEGEIFGEQAVLAGMTQDLTAEVMETSTIHAIPRDLFISYCSGSAERWHLVAEVLLQRQRELQKKIEMLCLKDVEQRILLSLAELAVRLGRIIPGSTEYSIPLSQSELASLIGATRETTSTTLNSLERRGLLHLGRRLLVISSIEKVLSAAAREDTRTVAATAAATASV
jgi:CRP-like cAMP-binding protein